LEERALRQIKLRLTPSILAAGVAAVVFTAAAALGEPSEGGSSTTLKLTSKSFNAMGEPTKDDLLRAMQGKVLEKTELIGTYQKGQ